MREEFLEEISEEVHNAWWKEKKKQGFHSPKDCPYAGDSYQQGSFDKFSKNCDKCHIDMYSYQELPENVKDYDRVTVKSVVRAIKKAGYSLSKYEENDSLD